MVNRWLWTVMLLVSLPFAPKAALILVLVSAGFATGDILIVKALGFGTALAIFVDATIVEA